MKLVVTIDTEEDNWDGYGQESAEVSNIERLPELQDVFDSYSARPTYLVTYPVVTDDKSAVIMRELHAEGNCEIGTHCHAWTTPPHEEEKNKKNSMLSNLSVDLQRKKIKSLHNAIVERLGVTSTSFRAGRWGYNKDTAVILEELGYLVDTSVMAYVDWSSYHGPDYSTCDTRPYKFHVDDIFCESEGATMLEVPATIGFLQKNERVANAMLSKLKQKPYSHFHLVGILNRLKLLNKIWLSPENSSANDMIALAKSYEKGGAGILNMFFHSSSLKAGLTPFVKSEDDRKNFLERIRQFLSYANSAGYQSVTLSEFATR